jgi:hypothetical protein
MEKSVFCQARDLPPEKRHAAEVLHDGALGEDDLLLVRSYVTVYQLWSCTGL